MTVRSIETGTRWEVTDANGAQYIIRLTDADNNGKAESLDILEAHILHGQRGFGLLLTGTLTTLSEDADLKIQAKDDLIFRGNIDLMGKRSDLTLESFKWVYWEGEADVAGDIGVYGGIDLSGIERINKGGANADGVSVYLHPTSRLVTPTAGTAIAVYGSQDVLIEGVILAGGAIGANGITYAGPDSSVTVGAGQRVMIDNAIAASAAVTVVGGTPGADDDGVAVRIDTVAGLTVAGWTSDGRGGRVTVESTAGGDGDIQVLGHILAGGTVTQTFGASGALLAETITWSAEKSTARLAAGGQLYLGGLTETQSGGMIETGGYVRASQRIELAGGTSADDIGVRLPGAAEVIVNNADGSIDVTSLTDADLQGLLIAGGVVVEHRDAEGEYLGRTVTATDGDSSIRIEASHQLRVGQDLTAGKNITLIGGEDPDDGSSQYAGLGLVLYGSVDLTTTSQNSEIAVSASGAMSILAPGWMQEIEAAGFAERASGRLAGDVILHLKVDTVDSVVDTRVTVRAVDTGTHEGLGDLKNALQAKIDAALGKDVITVRLREGRLLFTSAYTFTIQSDSTGAGRIGLTQLATGEASSSRRYAIDASTRGSVVTIGAADGANGRISIAAQILSYKALSIHGGESLGEDLDVAATAVLESLTGSVTIDPGYGGTFAGTVITRGRGSDIFVNGDGAFTLTGTLWAQDDITIRAGSVTTTGTAMLKTSEEGGRVFIGATGDITINSLVSDVTNPSMRLLEINSTTGTVTLTKESGHLETDAELVIKGNVVDVAGVIHTARATASTSDYEVVIAGKSAVRVEGTIDLAGSLLVSSGGSVTVVNADLMVDDAGQSLKIVAGGDVTLGDTAPQAGQPRPTAVTVLAHSRVQIEAGGTLRVAADARVLSVADQSTITIKVGAAEVAGGRSGPAWRWTARAPCSGAARMPPSTFSASGAIVVGGQGLDESGALVARGGALVASGPLRINGGRSAAGIGLSISNLSAVRVDVTGGGAWATSTPGRITVTSIGAVQIHGLISAIDDGATVSLTSSGLVLVDGLVEADGTLTVTGGTHSSRVGVLVTATVFDDHGQRVSGGTLDTAAGGTITVAATDGILIQGVVGQLIGPDDALVAEALTIQLTSSAGAVQVSGQVDAANSVIAKGREVHVLPGGRIKTWAENSEIRLQASDLVYVAGAADTATGTAAPGLVKADVLVHLMGQRLRVDGVVQDGDADTGRVLLNAKNEIVVGGAIRSQRRIEANAGVNTAVLSLEALTGTITASSLSGGTLTVQGEGSLVAPEAVVLQAGNDVVVDAASAAMGAGHPHGAGAAHPDPGTHHPGGHRL